MERAADDGGAGGGSDGFGFDTGGGVVGGEGFVNGRDARCPSRRQDGGVPSQRYGVAAAGIGEAGELGTGDGEGVGGRADDGRGFHLPPLVGELLVGGVCAVGDVVEDGADLLAPVVVEVGGRAWFESRRVARGCENAGGGTVVGVGGDEPGGTGLKRRDAASPRGAGLKRRERRFPDGRGGGDEAAEEVVGGNGVGDGYIFVCSVAIQVIMVGGGGDDVVDAVAVGRVVGEAALFGPFLRRRGRRRHIGPFVSRGGTSAVVGARGGGVDTARPCILVRGCVAVLLRVVGIVVG